MLPRTIYFLNTYIFKATGALLTITFLLLPDQERKLTVSHTQITLLWGVPTRPILLTVIFFEICIYYYYLLLALESF